MQYYGFVQLQNSQHQQKSYYGLGERTHFNGDMREERTIYWVTLGAV